MVLGDMSRAGWSWSWGREGQIGLGSGDVKGGLVLVVAVGMSRAGWSWLWWGHSRRGLVLGTLGWVGLGGSGDVDGW